MARERLEATPALPQGETEDRRLILVMNYLLFRPVTHLTHYVPPVQDFEAESSSYVRFAACSRRSQSRFFGAVASIAS